MSRLAKHDKTLSLLVLILSVFSIASFFFLSSSPASADTSASASASVTVGAACTFTSVVNTAHTATIPSGTNQSDIGQTTFTMTCNDNGGYSIYAVGYSNNEVGNNKLLALVNGSLAPSYDINTGSNASGTPSSWAMKLTPGTNLTASNILNGYTNYSVIPSSYTKIATLIPSTTVPSSSSLLATYRVNVAHTQPAGNYNGKVRFVMVDPNTNVPNEPKACSSNRICYWPNAGNEVTDSMGDQTITSSATSATLWASNFKRSGYGFVGWSDAYDYVANVGSESNPDAHIYGPNEDTTFTAGQYYGTNKGLSLYAVWVKSEGNLQNWNGCSSLGQGKVTALTDLRDNDTYAVAKLADGKCWMIENLRLDHTNLDNSTGFLAQGYGTSTEYGNFSGLADPETADKFSSASSANSLYSIDGNNNTININTSNAAYRFPRYNNNNTSARANNVTGYDVNIYSYGNYYTWAAAIADTSTHSINNQSMGTSLCPIGWHLPTAGYSYSSSSTGGVNVTGAPSTYREFYNLSYKIMDEVKTAYEDTPNSGNSMYRDTINLAGDTASKAFRRYPNNFVYSGEIYTSAGGSAISNRGIMGEYWSSTAGSNGYGGYYFSLSGARVAPGTLPGSGYYGYSIRCLVGS